MTTFTAPESLSSDLMPTAAGKYESAMREVTSQVVTSLGTIKDPGTAEKGAVVDLLKSVKDVLGSDTADNAETRRIAARVDARGTILRAALPMLDTWTGKDIARVFRVTPSRVSQIKRGLDRVAQYDALGIPAGDRWPVTDLEKKNDADWTAHIAALTATGGEGQGEGEGEGEGQGETAPKPADPVRAVERALDAIVSASWDPANVDDMDAMRRIADMLADATMSVNESMSA